jgi:hypothetical protein
MNGTRFWPHGSKCVFSLIGLEVRSGLEELLEEALKELGISESVPAISRRFIEGGFIEGYLMNKIGDAKKDRARKEVFIRMLKKPSRTDEMESADYKAWAE